MEEQEEKERKKKEEDEKEEDEKADAVDDLGKSLGEVALVQSTGQVIITFQQCHHRTMIVINIPILNYSTTILSKHQVATLESRESNTLPARDKPERSVRLMQEQGMLRKY